MFFSAIEKGYGLHNGNKKREKKGQWLQKSNND